jgi:hypothetical protein
MLGKGFDAGFRGDAWRGDSGGVQEAGTSPAKSLVLLYTRAVAKSSVGWNPPQRAPEVS